MPHSFSLYRIRIWDLPTRVFHALLAVCVAALFVTGELGLLQPHFWLGFTVLALIVFRLVWGFVGGHWSRFVNFIPTPNDLLAYVRAKRTQQAQHSVGHNPLGALSVLGMLGLLLLQVFSGFISDDEIAHAGPWVALAPSNWVEIATEYHTEIGKVLLIVLLALHISTVVYYKRFKHTDLITPMITGDKQLLHEVTPSRDSFTSRLFAFGVLSGSAYLVYRLVQLG